MKAARLTRVAGLVLGYCLAPDIAHGEGFVNPQLPDYVLPEACRELSDLHIPVITVERVPQAHGLGTTYAYWVQRPGGNAIYIAASVRGLLRKAVIQHELCHERMFRLTGDARWHGSE